MKGFHQRIRSELKGINPQVDVVVNPAMKGFQQKLRSGIGKAPIVEVKAEVNKASLKKAESEVTAAEKRMAAARNSSSDSVKQLLIAEKQLEETRAKSGVKQSQILAGELRVAQARRAAAAATNDSRNAESALNAARVAARDAKIKMQADADTGGLAAKLRAFSANAGRAYAINLGVDADTTGARMQMQAFALTAKRLATVSGSVTMDTGAAIAKLTLLDAVSSAVTTRMHLKWTAIGVAAVAAFAGIGAALVALPGLVAAALGPVAALVVGFQGVGDALSAFTDAQDQAATGATANAKAQASAARQIASAQQQVTQAQTGASRAYEDAEWAAASSLRRTQDAERSLLNAQKARLQAQRDLTRAVEDARRAQQDLNFEVEGGTLAERQAVLDLADAQQALEAARAGGTSGAAFERVQLAYEQQKLSLDEIRARNANLAQDKAVSDAAGISGSQQVTQAQDQVTQATEGVAAAQRDVADAQTAAAQQQIQSQRSIADAQLAVTQAQTQLTQAMQDAGTVGAASGDKIAAAMAKLSPNAREFVTAIQALKPAFAEMKNSVQDALFAGMGPAFTQFSSQILPAMGQNLGVVASAMNGATKEMFIFLSSVPMMDAFQQLFAGIGQVITAVAPVLMTFITLFMQLATAAMPGIIAIVEALGTVGTAIMQALQPLISTGVFEQALTSIANLIAALGPVIGAILTAALQLMNALGPSLVSLADALTPAFQALGAVLVTMAPFVGQLATLLVSALTPVLQALQPVIAALMPVLVQLVQTGLAILVPIIQALAPVITALLPVVSMLAGAFGQIFTALSPIIAMLGTVLTGVITALVPMVTQLVQMFVPFINQLMGQLAPVLGQLVTILGTALMTALQAIMPALGMLMQAFMGIVSAVLPFVPILAQIAGQLLTALAPILPTIAGLFLTLVNAVLPLVPPLLNLAATLLPTIVSVINTLMPIITMLANLLGGVLAVVLQTVVVPILNLVINTIKILADIFDFLWNVAVKPALDAIGIGLQLLWEHFFSPIFSWISDKVGAVGDAFKAMGDKIGGIWDGLKTLIRGGIQGVIDLVWNDGLLGLWRAANDSPLGGIIPDPPGRWVVPAFASGGPVFGAGTGTSDSIAALLSNGEYVVNAAATARWLPLLESMNANRFADGGIVAGGSTPSVPMPTVAATGQAAVAASLTVDPAALTALGGTVDAVTASMVALTTELNTIVMPTLTALNTMTVTLALAMQQLAMSNTLSWLQIQTTIVLTEDTIAARQLFLQAQLATSWGLITANVWANVNGQNAAFNALMAGMGNLRLAMAFTADWAGQQYGRIRAAAADPVRWVLQFPFNAGLISAWNALDGQFAFGKHVNPVPIAFASGGRVSGPGTGTSDSIDARLSRGEFVVREKIANQIYPFLNALNSGQAEALQATGYAQGGVVADTGSALNAAVLRGLAFAKAQDGKPYIWGAAGPVGFDCSGLMSAVTNVLRGESNPYRRLGVAASAPWPGFVRGLSSSFAMGSSPTHTAGTLGGVNIESTGNHVRFAGDAHGADDRQFPVQSSLPVVGGQFVSGGGGGIDVGQIVGTAFADTYKMIGQIATMFAGNFMGGQAGGVANQATDRVKNAATQKLTELTSAFSGAAGSPEVVAAVRAVASRYGWGQGPQWDSLNALIAKESSWNPAAANPTSSARGLFQKMTSAHGPLESTIAGQAEWGLNYIRSRYSDPIGAWAFHRAHNWYDKGGMLQGVGAFYKGTNEPERVLSPPDTRNFDRLVSHIGSSSFALPDSARLTGPFELSGDITVNGLDGHIDGRINAANHATGTAILHGSR
jgi:phage-related protein